MATADFPSDSFMFGNINSLKEWGIKVIAYDVFSAAKRPRSQIIPFRHGEFDYGEKYYNPKTIRLDCATEDNKIPSKSALREVIYHMSRRNQLRLWDEPDKYYVGELLESADVQVLPKYQKQIFVLPITCEPFAYHAQVNLPLQTGTTMINYQGTAETPTLIIIKNPNDFAVSNITITAVRQIRAE